MRYLLAALLFIFLAFVGLFAVQNTESVRVQFLSWGVTAPLAIVAVGIYFLGMISGWSVVAFLRRSYSRVAASPREY